MPKRLLALPLAAAIALGASVLPAGATNTIRLKDDVFSPKSTTVAKNSKVTFKWAGKSYHDVRVKSGPVKFHSSIKTKGTYTKKMTRKGTYKIVCTIHPGMELTLRVK